MLDENKSALSLWLLVNRENRKKKTPIWVLFAKCLAVQNEEKMRKLHVRLRSWICQRPHYEFVLVCHCQANCVTTMKLMKKVQVRALHLLCRRKYPPVLGGFEPLGAIRGACVVHRHYVPLSLDLIHLELVIRCKFHQLWCWHQVVNAWMCEWAQERWVSQASMLSTSFPVISFKGI